MLYFSKCATSNLFPSWNTLFLGRVRADGTFRELAEDVGDVIDWGGKHAHFIKLAQLIREDGIGNTYWVLRTTDFRQRWDGSLKVQMPWSCQSFSLGSQTILDSRLSSAPSREQEGRLSPLL